MKKNLSLLTLNITFVVLVSKVLALIREIVLAYAYGTSVTADAYTLVQSLVTTLEGIFMAATLAFMPVYQIYKLRNNTEKKEFLDSVYTILTVITCLAALLCLLSGDLIFKLLSPGLDKDLCNIGEYF
jgi:putative peptidoglycan lipid II flippase